jgi:hypothetical protein
VDYWPVGVTMPDAGSALELPVVARALPVSELPSVTVVQHGVARESRPLESLDRRLTPAVYAALPVALSPAGGLGETLSLDAPAVRPSAAPVPVFTEPAGPPLDEIAEPRLTLASTSMPASVPAPAFTAASEDTDGFISGAFKKTGSSIVKTSMKTGSSIVDAVRVVGGAVRKALPN